MQASQVATYPTAPQRPSENIIYVFILKSLLTIKFVKMKVFVCYVLCVCVCDMFPVGVPWSLCVVFQAYVHAHIRSLAVPTEKAKKQSHTSSKGRTECRHLSHFPLKGTGFCGETAGTGADAGQTRDAPDTSHCPTEEPSAPRRQGTKGREPDQRGHADQG